MSKFFVQLLLSVLVAASAAVGFSPHSKGEINKTMREVKSFTQQATQALFKSASDVDFDVDHSSKKRSETSVETSLTAESEIETELKRNNANLDLEHGVESDLDLDLGIGK